jgi:hypothetical protein
VKSARGLPRKVAMQHPFVVAIMHADEAIAASLAAELTEQGYSAVTAPLAELCRAPDEAERFLARHDPRVVVYDVSPWDESIRFLAFLCKTKAGAGRPFVLTTTAAHEHEPLLREAIDLRSCPHAVAELSRAVARAAASEPDERLAPAA